MKIVGIPSNIFFLKIDYKGFFLAATIKHPKSK